MMTPAQQHHEFGASVEASGEDVILQVGAELVALTPDQARRFAYQLSGAYYRSELIAGVESPVRS